MVELFFKFKMATNDLNHINHEAIMRMRVEHQQELQEKISNHFLQPVKPHQIPYFINLISVQRQVAFARSDHGTHAVLSQLLKEIVCNNMIGFAHSLRIIADDMQAAIEH